MILESYRESVKYILIQPGSIGCICLGVDTPLGGGSISSLEVIMRAKGAVSGNLSCRTLPNRQVARHTGVV